MATISASGAYPVAEKRDGGTVVMAGNIADGDPITLAKSNVDFGRIAGEPYGAKIVINDATGDGSTKDNTGIGTALGGHIASGTIAYQPTADDPQFLIRGYASKINNSADTTLQIVGSDFGGFGYDGVADSIKHVHAGSGASTSIDVLAQPSTNIQPSRTKGADAGLSYTFAAPSGNGAIASSGDRNALSPLTHPSPLVYMQGSPTPNSDEYKSPETYES